MPDAIQILIADEPKAHSRGLMRMSGTSRPAVEEQPQIGSYFVANYPPFSVWTKEVVERVGRPALATNPEPDVPLSRTV